MDGIERAFINDVRVGEREAILYGVGADTNFGYRIDEGRWHTRADEATAARVAVVERGMAQADGIEVGDRVQLATGTGLASFRVIGVAQHPGERQGRLHTARDRPRRARRRTGSTSCG